MSSKHSAICSRIETLKIKNPLRWYYWHGTGGWKMLVQLVPNFSDQLVVCPYCPFNECHVTETLIPVTPRQLSGRQVHIIVAFSSFPHSVMCSRIPMEHKHHFLLSFSFFSKIRTDQAKSGNQEIRSKIRRFLINQDEMDTLITTELLAALQWQFTSSSPAQERER